MLLRFTLAAACVLPLVACGGQQRPVSSGHKSNYGEPTPPPDWMGELDLGGDKLCGYGVAGAGYNKYSPYPKRMSEDRAVKNLAGVIQTRVKEAMIGRETSHSTSFRGVKAIMVDDSLIEQVKNLAESEYWLDVAGEGPFAAKGFTYAHTCIDARVAAQNLKIDASSIAGGSDGSLITPDEIPEWIAQVGRQADGRLCAVGFSLPAFHPDKTFEKVVEDVRYQLTEIVKAFVSSYFESLTTSRMQAMQQMTLSTAEGVSKGVIITHYWYDRDGRGPHRKKRSTYGFGCVFPVDIVVSSAAAVEEKAPEDEKEIIRQVRERAQTAWDELDAETEKRMGGGTL